MQARRGLQPTRLPQPHSSPSGEWGRRRGTAPSLSPQSQPKSSWGDTGSPLFGWLGFGARGKKIQLKLTVLKLSALEINLPPIGCW